MLFLSFKSYILWVIVLHIRDNIINYLYDKNYVICFYDNNLYIYKYGNLKKFLDNKVCFEISNDLEITIKGINLSISKITKEEVLLSGTINSIEKNEFHE